MSLVSKHTLLKKTYNILSNKHTLVIVVVVIKKKKACIHTHTLMQRRGIYSTTKVNKVKFGTRSFTWRIISFLTTWAACRSNQVIVKQVKSLILGIKHVTYPLITGVDYLHLKTYAKACCRKQVRRIGHLEMRHHMWWSFPHQVNQFFHQRNYRTKEKL